MTEKGTIGNRRVFEDDIIQALLDDPTMSVREIATKLDSYRQKIWRRKKKYENENVIWGYSAIVDESKMNHVIYLLLLKMKPMNKPFARLITRRTLRGEFCKQHVHLINVLFVNGQYDWIIMFSAPDHATARRYYDCLRIVYENYLLEKPVMVDVNFCLIREGKINPEIERLYEFVPIAMDTKPGSE